VSVTVPSNQAVLPPGPYMLFIDKGTDQGLVPSVATQVFVGAPVPDYVKAASAAQAQVLGERLTSTDAPASAPAAAAGDVLPATGARPEWPVLIGLAALFLALPVRYLSRRHGRIGA